ncbi:uncharacterized protein LOC127256576 [Andrographis paniculata]|uniref:uncharacterized protein LOC127256576 n=1 Tax=Andrographis paniculata TaxID=175694 RepID=UPI0021E77A1F|nr:uncharacterized protein LOC127256576 [Andrographis paniculata]XP_051138616.1 uncharacterized protein LOC127256576 [Andrographis paniculata]
MHSASFTAYKPSAVLASFATVRWPPPTYARHPKTHLKTSHSIRFSAALAFQSQSRLGAAVRRKQGRVSAVEFEEFVEKDWSILDDDDDDDDDDKDGEGERLQKMDRIVAAGNMKETSKAVLVAVGSEAFVDRVVAACPPCAQVLVVHESLFILAGIKERHDKVKCWQGEVINVPEKWAPLDAVYLYCLPALPFDLDRLLAALGKKCLPGARVVVSHMRGRRAAEEQRQQHPQVVLSTLPDKSALQSTAARHAFQVLEFTDDPARFYLAVLTKEA